MVRFVNSMTGCLAAAMLGCVTSSFAASDFDSSQNRAAPILLAQASRAPAGNPAAELDALVKAAKAEGEVTFYMVMAEPTTKRISDAFAAKYGIRVQFIRLPSTPLMQRYSSEADAGTFAAGFLIIAGGARAFAADSIKKGWMESVDQAGIPAITSGEFPAKFVAGPTAIIQVTPWALGYNTEKVKPGDAPKEWADIINPKLVNQVLLGDAKTSDSYLDLWSLLLDKYGESFFAKLRAQNPRMSYSSGTALAQGLAAGEGMVAGPTIVALIQGPKSRGAPIQAVIPAFTTGLEQQIMLTTRTKYKSSNASRLFVNYILSKEGNKVLNDEPGSVGVYDDAALPKEYQSPKPGVAARKEELLKLLGAK